MTHVLTIMTQFTFVTGAMSQIPGVFIWTMPDSGSRYKIKLLIKSLC